MTLDIPSIQKNDRATLTIQESGISREVVLEKDSYFIGRGTDCGIVLADSNVSRHHAELAFDGNSWSVADLQSVNGTFVNAFPVTARVLKHMDTIQIGGAMLVFNNPHAFDGTAKWNSEENAENPGFNFEAMQRVIRRLEENIGEVFKGNPGVIRDLIVCLMADGHLLLEDAPGVGKSLLAQTLAKSVQAV